MNDLIKYFFRAYKKCPRSHFLMTIAEKIDEDLEYIGAGENLDWIYNVLYNIIEKTDSYLNLFTEISKTRDRTKLGELSRLGELIGDSSYLGLEMELDNHEWMATVNLKLPEL